MQMYKNFGSCVFCIYYYYFFYFIGLSLLYWPFCSFRYYRSFYSHGTSLAFRDAVPTWITYYLHLRTFSVSTNGSVSGAFPVSHGIPQRSVLGPLLFLLYTIPLSHLVEVNGIKHHFFADDTQLSISFKPENFNEAMSALSNAFYSISNWMSVCKPTGFCRSTKR